MDACAVCTMMTCYPNPLVSEHVWSMQPVSPFTCSDTSTSHPLDTPVYPLVSGSATPSVIQQQRHARLLLYLHQGWHVAVGISICFHQRHARQCTDTHVLAGGAQWGGILQLQPSNWSPLHAEMDHAQRTMSSGAHCAYQLHKRRHVRGSIWCLWLSTKRRSNCSTSKTCSRS